MVNYDALIHSRESFSEAYILAQQERYNFTQSTKVELFLWDLEIFGQLQRHLGDRVTLKGGAAAQLYFRPEQQRTSVDIDVIYVGDLDLLHSTLVKIHQEFGNDDTFFRFNLHTPKNPTTSLPMETYHVSIPSHFNPGGVARIKVDFHFMESGILDIVLLESASAFVLPLAFAPRCMSAGSLLGDKLLTFARGSVGIPEERQDNLIKQLYDTDLLSKTIVPDDAGAMIRTMTLLFEHEMKIRPSTTDLRTAQEQMIALLEKYALVNSPTCEDEIKNGIKNFRGNYEPRKFRNPIDWEITAKRLQFLVRSISLHADQSVTVLHRADEIMKMFHLAGDERSHEHRQRVTASFLSYLRERDTSSAKRLKSTPAQRIFWEIIHPANIDEIREIVVQK
jgi:hypothetical protein